MDFSPNTIQVNALLLLFVFDKMDIPLTEQSALEICYCRQTLMEYMDYKTAFGLCTEKKWIVEMPDAASPNANNYFMLTDNGRMCLASMYTMIPSSLRAEVVDYVNANRMQHRRMQEYLASYVMNPDGSYTVTLKIAEPAQTIVEVRIAVPDRATAKVMEERWCEKAPLAYTALREILFDN
jgi:hypothetical protein